MSAAEFTASLTANAATVHGPVTPADAALTVADIVLAIAGVANHAVAVASGDPVLVALGIEGALKAKGLAVLTPDDPAWHDELPAAAAGVTGAMAGVIATGSVGVACGPGMPRATSLVPPAHVCVVRMTDVVATLADALERALAVGLPSNLVWISGPSRTGDLQMTITMGVHGPKRVDVVVVDA